ncbi:ABC transporter ATP-binding protein [Azospirillum sp. TSO35-2]|uniref:ABC transporter ATP-binding protein n=1 Tax=Azospirillum sp. TSO35-2 TaxID=716796 RepID=UPI000D6157D5|nr:ABC transporter ATP-binding protein [Azospirillum sp. TSO35-2]PWC31116.1 ABC transporter [Azospirillum sp. TSO35-2]
MAAVTLSTTTNGTTGTATSVIDLEGVSIGYGSEAPPVLVDVNLSVERGSFVAIVGPSGVGKSTLLRVVAGLHTARSGGVVIHQDQRPGHRPVGLVFQDARLLPWRRVVRNVEFGLEGLPVSRDERRRRAEAALKLVRLDGYARRWPYELSGGQRQRVGIARAMAVDPDILLMDEPFGALDAITRNNLQDELRRIHQETGKTILFVTHDLEEAVHLADRIIVLGGTPARVVRDVRNSAGRDGSVFRSQVDQLRSEIADNYSI